MDSILYTIANSLGMGGTGFCSMNQNRASRHYVEWMLSAIRNVMVTSGSSGRQPASQSVTTYPYWGRKSATSVNSTSVHL